ncbi:hypothetical protein BH23ACT2_BH23ACT2_25990 [soil metagenome]
MKPMMKARPLLALPLAFAMTLGGASMAAAQEDDNGSVADPGAEIGAGEETSSFDVVLDWRNEVDTPAGEEPDDPQFGQGQEGATGTATLRLDSEAGVICADLQVDGLDADDSFAGAPGAHVHQGGLEENGPIAVFFETPDDETGMSTGCFTDFEDGFDAQETLQMIEDNPDNWYVNVHSGSFPMGIVRGQLPGGGQDQLPTMMETPEGGVDTGAGGTADSSTSLLAYVLAGGAALAATGFVVRRRVTSDAG